MAIGLLTCAPFLAGCSHQEPYDKPLTPVGVRAVEPYSTGGGVRYSASIKPNAQVDLSFKASGYVREILQVRGADGRERDVQEGDWVTPGTILARVREADYRVRVSQVRSQRAEALASAEQARSQLAEARAAWEQARLDLDRASRLLATQSMTRPEYEAAQARFEAAQARVEGAQAQLEAIQARIAGARAQVEEFEIALQDCALKAPIHGLLLKRNIEVGTLVGPGTVGFVLADITSVKAVFGVPDLRVQTLKLGSPLAITTEAIPGVELRGQTTRISPAADPKSRVFEVEITIPNPQHQLKVGMIASLEVAGESPSQPIAVVPLTAIVRSQEHPEGYALFVVEGRKGQPVARHRNVELGEALGNRIAVTQGVKMGERVIVTGATLVTDGEPVRIIP
ncbi:MAG: efflux RND transporter periplasmic adaptor subunit [Candidatus Tectomicrobia bacterium]|uniref:Efflux RND transporter periplasmic adaptor subunit n=1 Tax=Tectimicrobiota bacterium TaxID=2528274 RepID=A0A932CL12_UNCTE|nr:efflux RND transporter periplasmic adaptor subunit [Candidatus Tectomicrobia bacterium]